MYEELETFDENFQPSAGMRAGLDTLPDGTYGFEIVEADLSRTAQTQELILRLSLKVITDNRPAMAIHGRAIDTIVDRAYLFRSSEAVALLGGDLMTLGFDSQDWTVANGRPFSKELPRVIPRLHGLRFRGQKKTKQNLKNPEQPYHNLTILARLPGGSATSTPPMPPSLLASAASNDDDEPPF